MAAAISALLARPLPWLLALLVTLLWVAWQAENSPRVQPEIKGYHWRRTTNGWERQPFWQHPASTDRPNIQPALIAALQMTLAIAALYTAAIKRPAPAGGASAMLSDLDQARTLPSPGPGSRVAADASPVPAGHGLRAGQGD